MSDIGFFTEDDLAQYTRWLEWQGMPEYVNEDLTPKYQIVVSFACAADVEEFGRLIGQKLGASTASRQAGSIWFPEQDVARYANKRYIQDPDDES